MRDPKRYRTSLLTALAELRCALNELNMRSSDCPKCGSIRYDQFNEYRAHRELSSALHSINRAIDETK